MNNLHILAAGISIIAVLLLFHEGFTPEPSHEWPYREEPMPLNKIAQYDAENDALRQKEAELLRYTPQPATLFPSLPQW